MVDVIEAMDWLRRQNEKINFALIDGNANPPVAYFVIYSADFGTWGL